LNSSPRSINDQQRRPVTSPTLVAAVSTSPPQYQPVKTHTKSASVSSDPSFTDRAQAKYNDWISGQKQSKRRGSESSEQRTTSNGIRQVSRTSESSGKSIPIEERNLAGDIQKFANRDKPLPNINNTEQPLTSKSRPGTSPGSTIMSTRKQSFVTQTELVKNTKMSSDIPQEVRLQAQDFVRSTSMKDIQSSPAAATPTSTMTDHPDRKQGFFKRVFGSSNSRSNLFDTTERSPSASRQGSLAYNNNSSPGQDSLHKRPASPTRGSSREVHKKSSSFFRRRKKSIVDEPDVPSLPPQILGSEANDKAARSSLYNAMNPFLNVDPAKSSPITTRKATIIVKDNTGQSDEEATDDPELFHSGYNNSPDRKIRTIVTNISTSSDKPASLMTKTSSFDHGQRVHEHGNSITAMAELTQTDKDSPKSQRVDHVSKFRDGQKRWMEHSTVDGDDVFVTPSEQTFGSTFGPELHQITGQISMNDTSPPGTAGREELTSMLHRDSLASVPRPTSNARTEPDAVRNMSVATTGTALTSMTVMMEGPTAADREHALSIYKGEEDFVTRSAAAAYLGERKAVNINTLSAYMENFEFAGQTILGGMRMLCQRLLLKAESQQVDRILNVFASRWCECNVNHGFKHEDVVHTICYSLLLLNTDLHMADIETRMTRAQFVKNTLPTIKRVAADVGFDAGDRSMTFNRPTMQWQDTGSSYSTMLSSPKIAQSEAGSDDARGTSIDSRRPVLTKRMSWNFSLSNHDNQDTSSIPVIVTNCGSTALVNDKFDGKPTEWHYELEQILKSFFTAIKSEALPLNKIETRIRRAGSIKSMAPSELSVRSRKTDMHSMSSRWGRSKMRNRLYGAPSMASSRSSLDDGSSSIFTPAGSSAWSKLSLGKSLTTASSASFGDQFGVDNEFPQTIGFANALSHTMAREDALLDDDVSVNHANFLLEDDTLELAGAPWAKEGMVKHKHHLETTDKKAKERNWNECFAVVEKGYLRLFSFNSKGGKTGSLAVRRPPIKGKAQSVAPSVVGGGNWMQNAEQLDSFLLRQTIASALPPPGYSKTRPNVWALSLPTGAVHLFQVGTASIAKEFVDTANYWSARLSKEPLMGGVDNIEYGWSTNIFQLPFNTTSSDLPTLVNMTTSDSIPPAIPLTKPSSRHGHSRSANNSISISNPFSANNNNNNNNNRASVTESIRSTTTDNNTNTINNSSAGHLTFKSKLIGDKAHLEDWTPPVQSMMASQLAENDQLRRLKTYVNNVEVELTRHNDLRCGLATAVCLFSFFLIDNDANDCEL